MPAAASVAGGRVRYTSPLATYRRLLKQSTKKVDTIYAVKDNPSAAMYLATTRAGFGDWTLTRWYIKQKVCRTNRHHLEGLYECVLCASCTSACPSYWWNREVFLGPAVLLQAYRWLIEPLDPDIDERLAQLETGYRLNMCHNILNCSITCPKYLNPGMAIKGIKSMIVPDTVAEGKPKKVPFD